MKNLFVPYDFAVRLKEKGMNPEFFAVYSKDGKLDEFPLITKDSDIPAPLWQQVVDWLRVDRGIMIEILNDGGLEFNCYRLILVDKDVNRRSPIHNGVTEVYWSNDIGCYNSYYLALQ